MNGKCNGKMKNGNKCAYVISHEDTTNRFCKRHIYLANYTNDDLELCQFCGGCGRWILLKNGYKSCDECRQRGEINRQQISESKKTEPDCDICLRNKCKKISKSSKTTTKGTKCCNLHYQKTEWLEDLDSRNKKPCKNHNRGCKTELDKDCDDVKCDKCINKDSEKSRAYELKRKQKRNEARNNNKCVICFIEYEDPTEFLDKKGNKTTKCINCRAKCAEYDRKARQLGIKKTYPLSEMTKEKKLLWRKQNIDKCREYWIKSRAKRMVELGDEYWKINAKNASEWRARMTEDEKKLYNESINKNINHKLSYYKNRAELKGIEWKLTDEDAMDIFNDNCYYCGCEPDDYRNGIDRINSDVGYFVENVVPACRVCNWMKGTLDIDIFLKRCEHIGTYLGIINGNYHYDVFPDGNVGTYPKYKCSAKKREIEFKISKEEYDEIIKSECYLCGKQVTKTHKNGIDRINSDLPYEMSNCMPCCQECNFMKNKYNYDIFLNKMGKICSNIKIFQKNIENENRNFGASNSNDISIVNKRIHFYRYAKSKNNFERSDLSLQMKVGTWKCIYNIEHNDDEFFEMKVNNINQYLNGELVEDVIIISNGIHGLPFILLSHSGNKCLDKTIRSDCYGNEIIKSSLSDIYIKIPYDHNSVKIEIIRYGPDADVISMKFKLNKNNIIKEYYHCMGGNNTIIDSYYLGCKCENCVNHYLHGCVEKCYWCSDNCHNNDSNYLPYQNDNLEISLQYDRCLENYSINNYSYKDHRLNRIRKKCTLSKNERIMIKERIHKERKIIKIKKRIMALNKAKDVLSKYNYEFKKHTEDMFAEKDEEYERMIEEIKKY